MAELFTDRIQVLFVDEISNLDMLNRLKECVFKLRKLSLQNGGEYVVDTIEFKVKI